MKLFLSLALLTCCAPLHAQVTASGRPVTTLSELNAWSAATANGPWSGLVLYQGSDSSRHFFIARVMDDWRWFRISRDSIRLPEVYPYYRTSAAPLGYYYVDPLDSFRKVRAY